ncbi:MAG: hypothetical protein EOP84_21255 [Verrucomicrobiaceae bacterium]|nr:MAG: hypothetical protein EOP84_21255 [Verrucomicrobiaceae bacterium]
MPVSQSEHSKPGHGVIYETLGYTSAASPFTMIVLSDTQEYCSQQEGANIQMFYSQTERINAQRTSRNIKYVMHVGDIVDHQNDINQWERAKTALYALDNTVPYGVVPGNHDWTDTNPTALYYEQYFGVSHLARKSYYGGHYGNDNNSHLQWRCLRFAVRFREAPQLRKTQSPPISIRREHG